MAQRSGVEEAIRELEREEKNIATVIKMLRKIQQAKGFKSGGRGARSSKPRVLSAAARKRISEAARKRWIAYRKAKAAA